GRAPGPRGRAARAAAGADRLPRRLPRERPPRRLDGRHSRNYKHALAGTRFAPTPSIMKKRRKSVRKRPSGKENDDTLLGPPARETVWLRSDREREAEEELRAYTSSSPA